MTRTHTYPPRHADTGLAGLRAPVGGPDLSLRSALAGVGLVMALATLSRFLGLGLPLWFDEIATYVNSMQGTLWQIMSSFVSNNDHPFYTFLAKLSTDALGFSEWSFRLPAALFGIAAVPATYWLAARLLSRREALAAALMIAVSYHAVWFSQNARGYTIMLVAALICTTTLHGALRARQLSVGWLAPYSLMAALAAYTHLTMVLFVIGQALVACAYILLVWRGPERNRGMMILIGLFGASAGMTVLFYAPMLTSVIDFFLDGMSSEKTAVGAKVASPFWAILAGFEEAKNSVGGLIPLLAIVTALGVGGISLLLRQPLATALVVIPVPVIVIATLVLGRPIFPRFFFYAAGFLTIAAAHGLWVIACTISDRFAARVFTGLALIAVLATTAGLPRNYALPKQNYEAAQTLVQERFADLPKYAVSITADLPMRAYLGGAYTRLDDGPTLDAALATGETVVVVHTFARYVENGLPDLWTRLTSLCKVEAVIEATVVGGEITISTCAADGA